jgi:hypothetical protein
MEFKTLKLGSLQLLVPESWRDLTAEAGHSDNSSVIGDSVQPVGVMKIWGYLYGGGEVPDPSTEHLMELARHASGAFQLRDPEPYHLHTELGPVRLAAASFRSETEFHRIWCVSDGMSFGILVYSCEWGVQAAELDVCEAIARSVRFNETGECAADSPIKFWR